MRVRVRKGAGGGRSERKTENVVRIKYRVIEREFVCVGRVKDRVRIKLCRILSYFV